MGQTIPERKEQEKITCLVYKKKKKGPASFVAFFF